MLGHNFKNHPRSVDISPPEKATGMTELADLGNEIRNDTSKAYIRFQNRHDYYYKACLFP